jgi:murein DD-endopeptidase MepM/ murein hydrolase activator NlpD
LVPGRCNTPEAIISASDHPREPLWLEQPRRHPRMLDQRTRPAPTWRPRILAAGAILAVGVAVIATLAQSVSLTGADPAASASGGASARVRGRVHPARFVNSRRVDRARAGALAGQSPADTLPFPPNRADRATRPGEVPSLYADGLRCSTGCRPYGAELGWPLAPFRAQHPIRAGLNELRPASLHVGVDIQARNGAAVYAVQPGVASVLAPSGSNARVQVGNYIYWHIRPSVDTGQYVIPFHTVVGTVMSGYGHMAFSELGAGGQYVNPLRPGGTVLEPYVDRAPPVIGPPAIAAGGQVIVSAYDPQTDVRRTTYLTPVLAPAAIAYRLYDPRGTAVSPLEWAFRGSQLLPYSERSLIFAPGAHAPGFACFATRSVCVPRWIYRVAGGLAPPLPSTIAPGRYRLTVYAWDWADNTTALDTTVTLTASGWRPIGRFPAVLLDAPGYFTQSELAPPPSSGAPDGHRAPLAPSSSSAPSAPSTSASPAAPAGTSAHTPPSAPRAPAVPAQPTGSGTHQRPTAPANPNGSASLLPSTPRR